MNYFEELNAVNVNDHTESKNGLTYLSWAWAWGELKKRYPGSFYTIYENKDGLFYHTDGKTAWVKTGVTIVFDLIMDGSREHKEIEHIEYLPVMDFKNRSIPLEQVTSFDVNKAIQRSLTKAVARHGLGLYIYAGEDLPEEEKKDKAQEPGPVCTDCGREIVDGKKKDGSPWPAGDIAMYSKARYERPLCIDCMKAAEAKAKEAKG